MKTGVSAEYSYAYTTKHSGRSISKTNKLRRETGVQDQKVGVSLKLPGEHRAVQLSRTVQPNQAPDD